MQNLIDRGAVHQLGWTGQRTDRDSAEAAQKCDEVALLPGGGLERRHDRSLAPGGDLIFVLTQQQETSVHCLKLQRMQGLLARDAACDAAIAEPHGDLVVAFCRSLQLAV